MSTTVRITVPDAPWPHPRAIVLGLLLACPCRALLGAASRWLLWRVWS